MRAPYWETEHVRWDEYKAFHIGVTKTGRTSTGYWRSPPFIAFDDGQVICTLSRPGPYLRGEYPDLGVRLVATSDDSCPDLFLPSGEKVTKKWLNDNGQQYLLIDEDHHYAVRLNDRSYSHPIPLTRLTPEARRCASVWFNGAGLKPVGASIAIRRPFRSMPKERRQQLDDFVCSAKAAMTLMGHPATRLTVHKSPRYTWDPTQHKSVITSYYTYTDPPPREKLPQERILSVKSWQELDEDELKRLFFAGYERRPRELVEYLLTERK